MFIKEGAKPPKKPECIAILKELPDFKAKKNEIEMTMNQMNIEIVYY